MCALQLRAAASSAASQAQDGSAHISIKPEAARDLESMGMVERSEYERVREDARQRGNDCKMMQVRLAFEYVCTCVYVCVCVCSRMACMPATAFFRA